MEGAAQSTLALAQDRDVLLAAAVQESICRALSDLNQRLRYALSESGSRPDPSPADD